MLVAKDLPDLGQSGAVTEHVGSKGMTEDVRAAPRGVNAGANECGAGNKTDLSGAQTAMRWLPGDEHRTRAQRWSAAAKVIGQGRPHLFETKSPFIMIIAGRSPSISGRLKCGYHQQGFAGRSPK